MPLFLDLHDMPDGVTAEHVAEMHQADLLIEAKYNCRGLTYWCDEKRQTAFCLIEAPNKEAIIELHENAHGDVPQRIIEVNDTIVESFLGRIEDPKKSQNTKLNIINDPAFRTLMVVKLKKRILRKSDYSTLDAAIRGYTTSIHTIVKDQKGRMVKQETNTFLISFDNVTNAMRCALKIQQLHNCVITPDIEFKIGLSAGIPITEKEGLFEDTIIAAERLCHIAKERIMITAEVKDLYESENLNIPIDEEHIVAISSTDETFLAGLIDYLEKVWRNPSLNIDSICNNLGYSNSQLYRKITSIAKKSTNSFIQDYRLDKALELLEKKNKNISEIAFETGFNSAAYFSKCFQKKYDMLPSQYRNVS